MVNKVESRALSWYHQHKNDVGFRARKAAYRKEWYAKNKGHVSVYHKARRKAETALRTLRENAKFGVVRPAEIKCRICGNVVRGRKIHLDHNHKTGKFRGWLCNICNTKLGWFENWSSEILAYLQISIGE